MNALLLLATRCPRKSSNRIVTIGNRSLITFRTPSGIRANSESRTERTVLDLRFFVSVSTWANRIRMEKEIEIKIEAE